MASGKPALLWLRHDLRLADQPALHALAQAGRTVIPVFIWAPEEEEPWAPGAASRWWLHQSLASLQDRLRQTGSRLIVRRGATLDELRSLIKASGADTVYWNRRYEPKVIARDQEIKKALRSDGLEVTSFNGSLLVEPWNGLNQSGKPYQVFTPFWRNCLRQINPAPPLPAPSRLSAPATWPSSLKLEALALEPKIDWAQGMREAWKPGESGARKNLQSFVRQALEDYSQGRNQPGIRGTSRLSPHLHFGEISPGQIWHAVRAKANALGVAKKTWRQWQFLAEVGWREFAHHLLYHYPHTPEKPLREKFDRFPWRRDRARQKAWQKGRTGFPMVDAGMRELWASGWMHNRVRMIAASFLIKDLNVPWQEGARWFWDTLVDADLANNTLGWQWVAGCGADAAPFFRIFNPVTQGKRYDPDGDYIRRWVPELAGLAGKRVHEPWTMSEEERSEAGNDGGDDYPEPMISHSIAREVALENYNKLKD